MPYTAFEQAYDLEGYTAQSDAIYSFPSVGSNISTAVEAKIKTLYTAEYYTHNGLSVLMRPREHVISHANMYLRVPVTVAASQTFHIVYVWKQGKMNVDTPNTARHIHLTLCGGTVDSLSTSAWHQRFGTYTATGNPFHDSSNNLYGRGRTFLGLLDMAGTKQRYFNTPIVEGDVYILDYKRGTGSGTNTDLTATLHRHHGSWTTEAFTVAGGTTFANGAFTVISPQSMHADHEAEQAPCSLLFSTSHVADDAFLPQLKERWQVFARTNDSLSLVTKHFVEKAAAAPPHVPSISMQLYQAEDPVVPPTNGGYWDYPKFYGNGVVSLHDNRVNGPLDSGAAKVVFLVLRRPWKGAPWRSIYQHYHATDQRYVDVQIMYNQIRIQERWNDAVSGSPYDAVYQGVASKGDLCSSAQADENDWIMIGIWSCWSPVSRALLDVGVRGMSKNGIETNTTHTLHRLVDVHNSIASAHTGCCIDSNGVGAVPPNHAGPPAWYTSPPGVFHKALNVSGTYDNSHFYTLSNSFFADALSTFTFTPPNKFEANWS